MSNTLLFEVYSSKKTTSIKNAAFSYFYISYFCICNCIKGKLNVINNGGKKKIEILRALCKGTKFFTIVRNKILGAPYILSNFCISYVKCIVKIGYNIGHFVLHVKKKYFGWTANAGLLGCV